MTNVFSLPLKYIFQDKAEMFTGHLAMCPSPLTFSTPLSPERQYFTVDPFVGSGVHLSSRTRAQKVEGNGIALKEKEKMMQHDVWT